MSRLDDYSEAKRPKVRPLRAFMNVYWSLKAVPELASLTPQQRRRVHHACFRRRVLFAPATVLSVSGYALFLASTILFAILAGSLLKGAAAGWVEAVGACVGAAVGGFIFSHIAIPYLRQFYREFIEKDETHLP